MKRFTVTAGSKTNPITNTVEVPSASGQMTPDQARTAARIAFGHTQGVTVSDDTTTYQLSGKAARKLNHYDE